MSCGHTGEFLMASDLIAVNSLPHFWWHNKPYFIDIKSVSKTNEYDYW